MPYRDPNRRREANARYQRQRAEAELPRAEFPEELKSQRPIRTVHDVLDKVNTYLRLLETGTMPVATRCRTAKELLTVALKGLEISDLGARIQKIEALLKQRGLPVAVPAQAQDEPDEEIFQ